MIDFTKTEIARLENTPSAIQLLIALYQSDQRILPVDSDEWKGLQFRIDELLAWKQVIRSPRNLVIHQVMMRVAEMVVQVSGPVSRHHLPVTLDGVSKHISLNHTLVNRLQSLNTSVGAQLVFTRTQFTKGSQHFLDYRVSNTRGDYRFSDPGGRPIPWSAESIDSQNRESSADVSGDRLDSASDG